MSEKMQYMRLESTAREIAKSIMGRVVGIPEGLTHLVEELLVEAAHDGLEAREGLDALEDRSGLEQYTLGYIHGLTDRDRGMQGE